MPGIDKEKIITQFKIAALAYGMADMAGQLNKPFLQLSNAIDERENTAPLSLRDALSIIKVCLQADVPEQSRYAVNEIIKAFVACQELSA
jgi:hypothetical protein